MPSLPELGTNTVGYIKAMLAAKDRESIRGLHLPLYLSPRHDFNLSTRPDGRDETLRRED
jgi:hypothetical protein